MKTTTVKNRETETMRRVLIGVPTLGTVRIEWAAAVGGLVIPCNWSNSSAHILGFLVADAQNILVQQALRDGFKYLLLLEDDVLPPANLFLQMELHMDAGIPVVSGLYHVKSNGPRPEPMIYRGRGNGAFRDWKPGQQVWADGVPTGCLLIHRDILQALWDESPEYTLKPIGGDIKLRKMFHTPRWAFTDMGTNTYQKMMGTSDLQFCADVRAKGIFTKAGFPKYQKKKFPFLVDTAIACGHIDRATGQVF